jgi:hypothetical protein
MLLFLILLGCFASSMFNRWCVGVTPGGVLEGRPYNNNEVFEASLNTS